MAGVPQRHVPAEESATALVTALRVRLSKAGAAHPQLLVYGESLGTLAARQVLSMADGAVLAGMPGAAWESTRNPGRAEVVLNTDDPVGWWTPRLLVRRPDGWPRPWLPVVTFWQLAGCMPGALDAPPGHGHHYGDDLAAARESARLAAATG